jgi:hypothetical protein
MHIFQRTAISALSLCLIACAAGCGDNASSTTASSGASPSVTGEWLFSSGATGSTSEGTAPSVAAGLVDTSGAVTGTGTVYGCTTTPQQTTLQGTVGSKGTFALTTGKLTGGAVLTLSGQLSADGKTVSSMALSTAGAGCKAAAGRSVTGQVYTPAQGDYAGTFTGQDGVAVPVTGTLSQSTVPGPGGSYTLSGSVSFPSSPCLDTATINSALSTVTGGALSATYETTVNGQTVTVTATGTADAAAKNVTITSWLSAGGECDGYGGTGSLTESSSAQ